MPIIDRIVSTLGVLSIFAMGIASVFYIYRCIAEWVRNRKAKKQKDKEKHND